MVPSVSSGDTAVPIPLVQEKVMGASPAKASHTKSTIVPSITGPGGVTLEVKLGRTAWIEINESHMESVHVLDLLVQW